MVLGPIGAGDFHLFAFQFYFMGGVEKKVNN